MLKFRVYLNCLISVVLLSITLILNGQTAHALATECLEVLKKVGSSRGLFIKAPRKKRELVLSAVEKKSALPPFSTDPNDYLPITETNVSYDLDPEKHAPNHQHTQLAHDTVKHDLEHLTHDGELLKALRSTVRVVLAAGASTRLGGRNRSTFPLNARETLDNTAEKDEYTALARRIDHLTDQNAKKETTTAQKEINDAEKTTLQARFDVLLKKAESSPRAITPIDIHVANVALESWIADGYIPILFHTSFKTHAQIRNYLRKLISNYEKKVWSKDAATNALTIKALKAYFDQVDAEAAPIHPYQRMSTRVASQMMLGYQETYNAMIEIEPGKLTYDDANEFPEMDVGAGAVKDALVASGMLGRFNEMGKAYYLIGNTESPMFALSMLRAHLHTQGNLTIFITPAASDSKGGGPVLMREGTGQPYRPVVIEASAAKELAGFPMAEVFGDSQSGQTGMIHTINTNSAVFGVALISEGSHYLPPEPKVTPSGKRIQRPKANLVDTAFQPNAVTNFAWATLLNYQDQKTLSQIDARGAVSVHLTQLMWAETVIQIILSRSGRHALRAN